MEKLERLCTLFAEELERQETVLAVTTAQGLAVRAHDLEGLEAKTAALQVLIVETAAAEAERLCLVREIVDAFALPVERQTLSDLIEMVDEPYRSRLRHFQTRMRETLAQSRRVVRENSRIFRHSIKVLDGALDTLSPCILQEEGAYDQQGREPLRRRPEPSFIDHRG